MRHEGFPAHRQALDWIHENKTILGIESFAYAEISAELDQNYARRAFWEKLALDMKAYFLSEAGDDLRNWLIYRGLDPRTHDKLPLGMFDFAHFTEKLGYTAKEFRLHGMPDAPAAYPRQALAFFYYDTPVSLSRIKLRFNWGGHGSGKHQMMMLGAEIGPNFGMFGLNLLGESKFESITCVEGEFDVLVLQSRFMLETGAALDIVCMSGSTMTSEGGASAIASLRLSRIHLWPDNDEAGRTWVAQLVKLIQTPGLYISVLWPEGYDALTPGEASREARVDPASYSQRTDLSAAVICKNLREGDVYVADWLADRECVKFLALETPTPEDTVRLQERILSISFENSLKELTLANYIQRCCKHIPTLNYDVLWKCAVSGYSLEPPTRASIGGNVYISSNDGYIVEITKKDGTVQLPMTDFRVKIHKWVSALDPVEGRTRSFAQCSLLRAGAATPFTLTDKEFGSFTAFREAIHSLDPEAVMDTERFKKCYDEVIRMMNKGAERQQGTLCLGFGLDTEKYVMPNYVVEGGKVTPNKSTPILLGIYGKNFLAQRAITPLITDPELLKESAELITGGLLTIHDDKAALVTLLAHIVASPVVEMADLPKGILFFEGATQAGKTIATQLFMNLVWDYSLNDGNVNFASTVNFIEMTLSAFRGLPLMIDDAKTEVLEGNKGQLVRMIQAYYDRQGRGRLNSKAETKSPASIQGHLIITGESLPVSSGSVFNRMIMMTFKRGGLDMDQVNSVRERRKVLAYVWPHYIAYLQRQPKLTMEKFAFPGAGRLGVFIDYQGTSLRLFLNFLVEECGLAREKGDEIMKIFTDNLLRLTERNQAIQGQFDDATLFVDMLAQLIHSDPNVLCRQPGIAVKNIGFFKDPDTVCIYPNIAIREVGRSLDRTFSSVSLGSRLKEAGYVEATAADGCTRLSATADVARARVWQFPAAKLFATMGMPKYRDSAFAGPNLNFPPKRED
jgi:hypothetical protein